MDSTEQNLDFKFKEDWGWLQAYLLWFLLVALLLAPYRKEALAYYKDYRFLQDGYSSVSYMVFVGWSLECLDK